MNDDHLNSVSHVSISTNNFARALQFYDQVLPTLGCRRLMQHREATAHGKLYPEFWVQTPIDGNPASIGNRTHVGFLAPTPQAAYDFYDAALRAGGKNDGAPGPDPFTASRITAAWYAISMATRSRRRIGT